MANNYNTKLEKVDLSVKGWNWGVTKFEGISSLLSHLKIVLSIPVCLGRHTPIGADSNK